ncbi:hypothetical protein [Rhizobium sp. R635]|nr:hypothetical protein [Rhizobium sp. R635]
MGYIAATCKYGLVIWKAALAEKTLARQALDDVMQGIEGFCSVDR